MGHSKRVKQVVAYVWDCPDGNTREVPRAVFWPGCAIVEIDGKHYANIDWGPCPVWTPNGEGYTPEDPQRELLECGHELPMRVWNRAIYFRPGRVCKVCAAGFAPSTETEAK